MQIPGVSMSIDKLEAEHQGVKRAYLAWCPAQTGLVKNGVGSKNNRKTTTFLEMDNYAILSRVLKLRDGIIGASEGFNRDKKYEMIREIYFVHPSFHEIWWIDKHFKHDCWSVQHHSRYGLDKLSGYIDGGNSRRIYGSSTFLMRYTLLLENLLSSRLTTSLLEEPPDQEALKSNVAEIVDTWGNLTMPEVAKEMPSLFSIIHTLLDMTDYEALSPSKILSTSRWLSRWAQCSVNEGPLFIKTSDRTRIELFRSLPSLDDQPTIRDYLHRHYAISCEEYDHVLNSVPLADHAIVSERDNPGVISPSPRQDEEVDR